MCKSCLALHIAGLKLKAILNWHIVWTPIHDVISSVYGTLLVSLPVKVVTVLYFLEACVHIEYGSTEKNLCQMYCKTCWLYLCVLSGVHNVIQRV